MGIAACIDNVFVYPTEVDIERLKEALSQTLSLWSLGTGRFRPLADSRYFIEMVNNCIPVTYTKNTDLEKWSLNREIVVDIVENQLLPFINALQTTKLLHCPGEELLVRLRLTQVL